jgi:CIC family chloride channel protein
MSKRLHRFTRYFQLPRLRTGEPFFQYLEKWIALSAILGVATGLVVAVFDYVTNIILWSFFSNFYAKYPLAIMIFLAPSLVFSGFVSRKAKSPESSGTDEVIHAYHTRTGKMSLRKFDFPAKMLGAVATIGFGGSAGQEGPSIYAGGIVGTWLSEKLKRFKLSSKDRRILVLSGAAAGIGAVFKAPLTGTIFALEVPFKNDLAHDAVIPSLVASVSSYLTLIAIDGSQPLFMFPVITGLSLLDIAASAALGLITGLGALLFITVYKGLRRIFQVAIHRYYARALFGALGVSLIGALSVLFYQKPYPLGISYDLVNLTLSNKISSPNLLVLFVMKALATSLTLGTTGVGGIFIPQIVMGGLLGGVFGQLVLPSRLDLFVAVGMAAFLAAGYNTPLAAVTFVAETASGPGYLIPSLIAAAISYSISGEASVSDYQKLRGRTIG